MARPFKPPPLNWSAIAVLVILGGLVAIGLAANRLSLLQSLVALAFGAGVLLLVWMWHRTLQRAETSPPLNWSQRARELAVFVVWLAATAALVWWEMAHRTRP